MEYIVQNGMMKDFSVLQELPFTEQGSIVDVFTDLSVWMGIRKVRNYYETGNNRQNQKVYRRQGVGAVPFSANTSLLFFDALT